MTIKEFSEINILLNKRLELVAKCRNKNNDLLCHLKVYTSKTVSEVYLMNSFRSYDFAPEQTWEQWQWRGTPHSPKPQLHWNLTIRLFSVNIFYELIISGRAWDIAAWVQSLNWLVAYTLVQKKWHATNKGGIIYTLK